MGMKRSTGIREGNDIDDYGESASDDELLSNLISYSPVAAELVQDISSSVEHSVKGAWNGFDDKHLKPLFGGKINSQDPPTQGHTYENKEGILGNNTNLSVAGIDVSDAVEMQGINI